MLKTMLKASVAAVALTSADFQLSVGGWCRRTGPGVVPRATSRLTRYRAD
jgi:hypothetical protein